MLASGEEKNCHRFDNIGDNEMKVVLSMMDQAPNEEMKKFS